MIIEIHWNFSTYRIELTQMLFPLYHFFAPCIIIRSLGAISLGSYHFSAGGGHLFVMASRNFFLPPLCIHKKILVPPALHRSKARITMLIVMDSPCTGHHQHLLANVAYTVYFLSKFSSGQFSFCFLPL